VKVKSPLPVVLSGAGGTGGRQIELGSIAWKQGFDWKYIPPPYTDHKPQSLGRIPPVGARAGGRTPAETLQIIGKSDSRVPEKVALDLGWSDVEILRGREIRFAGGGLNTNVGSRIENTTQGMSIDEPGDDFWGTDSPLSNKRKRGKVRITKAGRKANRERGSLVLGGLR
jgi:hypothetical protein